MKKTCTTFLLACFMLLGIQNKVHAQISPALSARLQNTLDSVCNKYKIKGTSAAVLIPGVGVWKGANGYSHQNTPITTNMLLGMGSNTKTHIAALLLIMQEKGLISLDDSIGKWIQGYPNISGRITIRQCLNHTSGLHDYMQSDAINDSLLSKPEKLWTKQEILRIPKQPNAAPGGAWDYSNTNYIIAGIIIEEVLQKSAWTAMKEWIFTPHQLNNTFNYGESGSLPVARPWSVVLTGEELEDMTQSPYLNSLFSLATTAGSLITTAEDNVWFWHKLCTKQLFNAQSWKEMTNTVSIGGQHGYGLGIFRYSRLLNGRTLYTHGGTFFGYINENMFDTTSGVAIAVLTNQDSLNNNGLVATVINALHKVSISYLATGLTENTLLSKINVYPNPANDVINLDETLEITDVKLMDISGKIVLAVSNQNQLDVSNLPNGLYVLIANSNKENKQYQQRIVVQH
jgi:D-alanyl-D-alanine carboxypeptidase